MKSLTTFQRSLIYSIKKLTKDSFNLYLRLCNNIKAHKIIYRFFFAMILSTKLHVTILYVYKVDITVNKAEHCQDSSHCLHFVLVLDHQVKVKWNSFFHCNKFEVVMIFILKYIKKMNFHIEYSVRELYEMNIEIQLFFLHFFSPQGKT